MPSPFPDMDPYLEDPDIWEDFHAVAAEVRDQITPHLLPRYYAALSPRITYEEVLVEETRIAKRDVSVLKVGEKPLHGRGIAIAPAPVEGAVALEVPVKEQSIEIRETKRIPSRAPRAAENTKPVFHPPKSFPMIGSKSLKEFLRTWNLATPYGRTPLLSRIATWSGLIRTTEQSESIWILTAIRPWRLYPLEIAPRRQEKIVIQKDDSRNIDEFIIVCVRSVRTNGSRPAIEQVIKDER